MRGYKRLLSKSRINKRIKELARQINKDYRRKSLIVVCVLDGTVFFAIDLVRHLKIKNLQMEFIGVASYKGVRSSEKPTLTKKLRREIKGQHILLLEDVLDTGYTLDFVQKMLQKHQPSSLKTAVLIVKKDNVRKVDAVVDYAGFTDVEGWLIGYGMDTDGYFRNLESIFAKKD